MLYSRGQDDPSHLAPHRVPVTGSLFFGECDEPSAKTLGTYLNYPSRSGHYAHLLSYTAPLPVPFGGRMSETCVENSYSMGRLFGQPVVTPHAHSGASPGLFMSPDPAVYEHSVVDTGLPHGFVAHRPGSFYSRGAAGDGNDVVGKPSLGMGIGMNGSSSSSSGVGHRRSHSGDFNDSSITVGDGDLDDSSSASPTTEPQKKKQKRNKPTLSCFECVERKTKVCFAFLQLCLFCCVIHPSQPAAHCTLENVLFRLDFSVKIRLSSTSKF